MEGGVNADQHSPLYQLIYARRPPRFQVRKRYEGSYNGVKACTGACQNITGNLLSVIPGPLEGLRHRVPIPPSHNTRGLWSGASDVWDLGDFMVMPTCGAEAERIP